MKHTLYPHIIRHQASRSNARANLLVYIKAVGGFLVQNPIPLATILPRPLSPPLTSDDKSPPFHAVIHQSASGDGFPRPRWRSGWRPHRRRRQSQKCIADGEDPRSPTSPPSSSSSSSDDEADSGRVIGPNNFVKDPVEEEHALAEAVA
jgi:hypothetical protein